MTHSASTPTIAVLGTGLIGAPVARNLKRKGFHVRAWNRTRAKAEALEADGVTIVDTPAEAVRGAAVVVTVLKDGPATQAAMEAAAPGLAQGAIWLQLGTVGVAATKSFVTFAQCYGLVLFDAPVLGTRQPAEQGQLTILAAGPEAGRAAIQPVFDAIGKKTMWLSDRPGYASRLKLALNAWVLTLTHGTAESLTIARTLGVNPALVVEAVTGGPLDSGYFQAKSAAMLADDYTTSFSVENGAKDAQLVVDAATAAGGRADLAEAGLERFRRAIAAGHRDKDIAASFLA